MTAIRAQPVRDAFRFFARFVRRPSSVGSIVPSSRFLARALFGEPALTDGDVVVEYGPGTGAITAAIAAGLPAGVRYLGIEIEPRFCELLRARYPRLAFHCGSVADVESILGDEGLDRPKWIVSGLPFASLPGEVRGAVIDATRDVLDSDGQFRTFQYLHAYWLPKAVAFRKSMAERFSRFERIGPIVRNIPPAWVLAYRR